jgi:PPM family protein phosphatase
MAKSRRRSCPNPGCGEPALPDHRFCESCGTRLPGASPPSSAGGGPVRVEVARPGLAGVSDRGLRRPRNEDALALSSLSARGARVLIVCDGVSRSEEPWRAAQAAADAALGHLVVSVERDRADLDEAMRDAVDAAQAAVSAIPYEAAAAKSPPASTLVAAVVTGRSAVIASVGDSRAYFVGEHGAIQLSDDDSWAAEEVRAGRLSREQAARDPRAHAVTRWLGADEAGVEPTVTTFVAPSDGHLVLCSDGLWGYAGEPERLGALVGGLPPDTPPLAVAQSLTEFALASGGRDNVTVAVAPMQSSGAACG